MKTVKRIATYIIFATTCFAGTIFTSVRVHPGFQSPDSEWTDFEFSTTASISSADGISDFDGKTFSGSATAEADFGVLKAFAAAAVDSYVGVNFYGPCPSLPSIDCNVDPSAAYASFGDTFTFTGGTGTGYLVLDIDITGSVTFTGFGGAQGLLNVYKNSELPFGTLVQSTPLTGNTNYSSPVIEFTYGTPIALAVELNAFVWTSDEGVAPDFEYSLTGEAAFGQTAQLTGLRIFSDLGMQNQVLNAGVSSTSGTSYPIVTAAAVPEPASLLTLGGGLLLLAFGRSRLRRK